MGERGKADVNDAGISRKKLVETLNIKLDKLFASVCSNKPLTAKTSAHYRRPLKRAA